MIIMQHEGYYNKSRTKEFSPFQSSKYYSKKILPQNGNSDAEQAAKRIVGALVVQKIVGEYNEKGNIPEGGQSLELFINDRKEKNAMYA